MYSARRLELVLRTFLGNPFDVDAEVWREADEALAGLDLGETLYELLEINRVETAKQLILAAGHRRACDRADPPGAIFDPAVLPAAILARMPRPAGDYLRVVAAAGRCYRALTAIRGHSEPLRRTRRDTWAACFGDSLRHALDLERVIRDHDVLILGATGTGKEAIARAIQVATPGPAGGGPAPTAAINAAALPDTLVESELFGHVKGAFTGATETRTGRLRSADGGAFFLDEVGDLPGTTQVKLLRVIETNEVFPLGSDAAHHVDVRYVAATHKDLEALVEDGEFRRDLFERLAGNIIRIPPLRDRPEDIRDIADNFVAGYLGPGAGHDQRAAIERWVGSVEAQGYRWPGNVRELQNVLRNLLLGLPTGISLSPEPDPDTRPRGVPNAIPDAIINAEASLQDVDDWYMRRVLDRTDGNITQAAKLLGIDRSTLRRRLEP
ncbi:sigma 54-interacting transcriptional regulator [Haliangium sp.]|uniref:sigma 54-interacting transcriptional regulator n=1 Tax=Haliangium sp. TaxID=2663208 RepID=UPI003D12D2D4